MQFPTADSIPYLQMDGRDGAFRFGEGQDNQQVDLKDKPLAVNIAGAIQGWLAIGGGGADWQPLEKPDNWGTAPSHDHKPGVAVMVYSEAAFGSDKGYRFRGNSGANNRFIQAIFEKAGAEVDGKMPLIRITEVKKVK